MSKEIQYYPELLIPTNQKIIINPVLTYYSLIKQIRKRWIYNQNLDTAIRIENVHYSLPTFLPEAGCFASLDTVSSNIYNDFKEKQRSYNDFRSSNEVVIAKVHNHDQIRNRVVSKGEYYFHQMNDFFDLYINNIENEIALCPSIIHYNTTFSPTRWFNIYSEDIDKIKCVLNYNYVLLHIKKEDLYTLKTENLFLDRMYELYKIECGLIKISKDGQVWRDSSIVYFTENPYLLIEHLGDKGEYFICYTMSFNDYNTTNQKCDISNSYVNIVNGISDLVFSIYDLYQFIIPYFIDMNTLDKCVYKATIPDEVLSKIINRLYKYSSYQNEGLIKGYEEWKKMDNVFMKYNKIDDNHIIYIINPGLVSYILKKHIDGTERDKKNISNLFGERDKIFNKILEYDEKKDSSVEYFVRKYDKLSYYRLYNMRSYMNIFNYFNS